MAVAKEEIFFWPLILNKCASEAEAGVKLSHSRTFSIRKSGEIHIPNSLQKIRFGEGVEVVLLVWVGSTYSQWSLIAQAAVQSAIM